MKKFLLLLSFIILPLISFSQSRKQQPDANGNIITIYKDKSGKVVGKSIQRKMSDGSIETIHKDRQGKVIGRERIYKDGRILITGKNPSVYQ